MRFLRMPFAPLSLWLLALILFGFVVQPVFWRTRILVARNKAAIAKEQQIKLDFYENTKDPNDFDEDSEMVKSEAWLETVKVFSELEASDALDVSMAYAVGQTAYWIEDYPLATRVLSGIRTDHLLGELSALYGGAAYWNIGQTEQALAVWGNTPGMASYFSGEAFRAERREDFRAAETHYWIRKKLSPPYPSVDAGYWYARTQRLLSEKSVDPQDLQIAIDHAYDLNADAYTRQLELGVALYTHHYDTMAIKPLQRAIALNERSHWAYYYLGLVYYRTGQLALAVDFFKRVLELAPDFGHANFWLARSYVHMGLREEALEQYKRACELLPDDEKMLQEYQKYRDAEP